MTNATPPSNGFDPQYGTAPYGSGVPQFPAGPVEAQPTHAQYGVIGTIIAGVALVLAVFSGPLMNLVCRSGDSASWRDVYTIQSYVTLAINVAILIFGLVGMRRDRDRLFAGIAIGVGGFGVLSMLLSYLVNSAMVFI